MQSRLGLILRCLVLALLVGCSGKPRADCLHTHGGLGSLIAAVHLVRFPSSSLPLPQAFGVTQADAASFDQQHPAPERPSLAKPSPAKAAAGGSRGRPAKRARVAQGGDSGSSDSEEGEDAAEEEEQNQDQEQQEQEPQQEQKRAAPQQQGGGGLTEMERQRLELIKRNREVRKRS